MSRELFTNTKNLYNALNSAALIYGNQYTPKPSSQGERRLRNFKRELNKIDMMIKTGKSEESLLEMVFLMKALFESSSGNFTKCLLESLLSGSYITGSIETDNLNSTCLDLSIVRSNIKTFDSTTEYDTCWNIDKKTTLKKLVESCLDKKNVFLNANAELEFLQIKKEMEPKGYGLLSTFWHKIAGSRTRHVSDNTDKTGIRFN